MTEIIVRKDYSAKEVERAELARSEYRRNRFTTNSAQVDDLIALGKALALCDPHARKFWPHGGRQFGYEPHPDPVLRRITGNCDVCNTFGLLRLFVSGTDAVEHRMRLERWKRDLEYAHIVTS